MLQAVHRGMHACEWSGEAVNFVSSNFCVKFGVFSEIAVGTHDYLVDLRSKPRIHMFDQTAVVKFKLTFIDTTQARSLAASQDASTNVRVIHHNCAKSTDPG